MRNIKILAPYWLNIKLITIIGYFGRESSDEESISDICRILKRWGASKMCKGASGRGQNESIRERRHKLSNKNLRTRVTMRKGAL